MRYMLALVLATSGGVAAGIEARESALGVAVCPVVVAHGAGKPAAPENTAAGIGVAGSTGAPMVEVDVRWTVTGYPVLMHDPTVDRTTDGTGEVAKMGLGDLTKLSAAAYAPWQTDVRYGGDKPDGTPKAPVPYAWDFLNAAAGADVDLLLDVKAVPNEFAARKLVEYVDRFAFRTRLIYMGNEASVKAMRTWFPGLRYAYIEYPAKGTMRTGEWLKALGVVAYAVPAREVLKPDFTAYYRSYGLQVMTWTSDSAEWDNERVWDVVTGAGVDYIITGKATEVIANNRELCS